VAVERHFKAYACPAEANLAAKETLRINVERRVVLDPGHSRADAEALCGGGSGNHENYSGRKEGRSVAAKRAIHHPAYRPSRNQTSAAV
jgi:hypothetical protein